VATQKSAYTFQKVLVQIDKEDRARESTPDTAGSLSLNFRETVLCDLVEGLEMETEGDKSSAANQLATKHL
jgi:hypothetical protein